MWSKKYRGVLRQQCLFGVERRHHKDGVTGDPEVFQVVGWYLQGRKSRGRLGRGCGTKGWNTFLRV